jgi:hypothetical protein
MNSYAEKTQSSDGHAIANRFSSQQNGNEKTSAQFHAPNVIQRYTIVQPDNLHAQSGATVETQDVRQTPYSSTYITKSNQATQTGFDPTTQETTTERVSGNVQPPQVSGLPAFKVSQNGIMALPEEGQAKNFYTTPKRVAETNKTLQDNGATVRLKSEGHGITVPKNPVHPNNTKTNTLKKVHVATEVLNNVTQQMELQIQQVLPFVNCNDFVELVMGAAAIGSRVAVLKNRYDQQEVPSVETQEPVKEIATHISSGKPSPTQVENRLRNQNLGETDKKTGIRNYENLGNKKRTERSEELGINELAKPKVGEGYVVKSMESNEQLNALRDGTNVIPNPNIVAPNTNSGLVQQGMRDDYLQALQDLDDAYAIVNKSKKDVPNNIQNMMKSWGVHYAGVVGADGPDTVTLENYNRSVEITWEHQRIFNNLFKDFDDFRDLVSDRVSSLQKAPADHVIEQLVTFALQAPLLQLNYQNALQEALDSFQTGLHQSQNNARANFFFDMYGPGLQSFHERYKGLSTNSVTLNIKETVQPVAQGATNNIALLHNSIASWEAPVLAHPMTGPAQAALLRVIRDARAVETQANIDFAAANTRSDYLKVITNADDAWNTLQNDMRQHVRGAFQVITGNAPVPAINTNADISPRCIAYRATYTKWYHFHDAAYRNSVQLEAMAQAYLLAGIQ